MLSGIFQTGAPEDCPFVRVVSQEVFVTSTSHSKTVTFISFPFEVFTQKTVPLTAAVESVVEIWNSELLESLVALVQIVPEERASLIFVKRLSSATKDISERVRVDSPAPSPSVEILPSEK